MVILNGLILDLFYFGRVCCLERTKFCQFLLGRLWWTWNHCIWIIFTLGRCGSLERTGDFTAYRITNCHVNVCVCRLDCHMGQSILLNWPMAKSANAFGLHHHCCQCWHHHLLCLTLLITWLMPVNSFVVYILAYIPYWCTLSNLGMWQLCDNGGANLLLANIQQ